MIECILAWICIIWAFFRTEPLWAIASALFALIIPLKQIADGGGKNA